MNWVINKVTGLGGVWDKLDGSKSYIGGAIGILSGVAGLLGEILQLIADKNAIHVWDFIKHLPADQYVLAIGAGLAAVGLRHAIAKQDSPEPAKP